VSFLVSFHLWLSGRGEEWRKHGRDGIRFGAQVHERKSTSANLVNYLGTPLPAASSPESSRANP